MCFLGSRGGGRGSMSPARSPPAALRMLRLLVARTCRSVLPGAGMTVLLGPLEGDRWNMSRSGEGLLQVCSSPARRLEETLCLSRSSCHQQLSPRPPAAQARGGQSARQPTRDSQQQTRLFLC